MGANAVMNLLFVFPLAHAGLALATTLSAYLNAALLFVALRKQGVYSSETLWWPFLLRTALATTVMAAILWLGMDNITVWTSWSPLVRATNLVVWVSAGAVMYFGTLWLLGLRLGHMALREPSV
jgi:putative peptidoglycan lipid II flippase